MRAWIALALLAAGPALAATEPPPGLKSCWLKGVEQAAWCGSVRRPLDPAQPAGTQIDVHFAVLPAVARHKLPDAVFFFAGGPGQSALDLAGTVAGLLARLSNRRDIVLIDQRGTGESAPLRCDPAPPTQPIRAGLDVALQVDRLRACRAQLSRLPYGDLRQFTTTIAMQDADAVRRALGAERVDLIGASYGTRAALEYLRQFPQAVRRVVLDGVAPPDMALPATFSPDAQAAFDALLGWCKRDAACAARYPRLRAQWHELLAGLPREVTAAQPVTGVVERFTMTREMLLGLVRLPLYAPLIASALPFAVSAAAQGRFDAIVGLASALGGGRGRGLGLAEGMHFSVVCAEDWPRMAGAAERPGADFGNGMADLYRRVCADWPRSQVPAAFYTVAPAPVATLLLSGGLDPVTPPRHAEHVARALGAKALSVVVANAGHGLMSLGCMRDVVFRFIDATSDAQALKVDTGCARGVPRPSVFVPLAAGPTP
jgi:pimeloyl-ACP methyl ester carboxylesterase